MLLSSKFFHRCRLRKKNWKNPAKVYLDEQRFEDDISLLPNWEMFLQELPESEKVTTNTQLVLFVRRWCPSTLELKPFDEVLLDGSTVEELKTKVSYPFTFYKTYFLFHDYINEKQFLIQIFKTL